MATPMAPVATTTESAGPVPAAITPWVVYIVTASDGSFYTGVTTNVVRRLREHSAGRRGAKYFNARRQPVAVVFCEAGHDRSSAARREAAIKKFSHAAKAALIAEAANSA